MSPTKVILDMDTGVDDALAILLALRSPELEILGITAVAGNAPLDMTSRNTLRVLEAAGEGRIPVAAGAAKPLAREAEAAFHVHGDDGLGGAAIPQPSRLAFDPRTAVAFIQQTLLDHPAGEVTLIPTGPLTNIAQLFRDAPETVARLARIVLMGGAFGLTPYGFGNVTSVSEFNIWADPEAAAEVFGCGADITAVGLDVTTDPRGSISADAHSRLRGSADPFARMAAEVSAQVLERFGSINLHDPLAVAAVIDPTLIETRVFPTEVVTTDGSVRGQTIADRRGRRAGDAPRVNVAVAVDGPRFLDLVFSRLTQQE